jgi:hypothetical protein
MASRTVVELIDDLDNKPIKQGEGETVNFALDGAEYTIDLSKANADKLRKAMAPYIDAARTMSGKRRGRGRAKSGDGRGSRDHDPKAVRKWAESRGLRLPARGRIPANILEQFHAAGN